MSNITKEDLIITMLERIQHQVERNEDQLRDFRKEVDERFEKADEKFDDVKKDIEEVKGELKRDIEEVKDELKKDIEEVKAEIVEIRGRDVSWSVRIIAIVLGLNSLISYLIAKVVLSGMKLAEVVKFWA